MDWLCYLVQYTIFKMWPHSILVCNNMPKETVEKNIWLKLMRIFNLLFCPVVLWIYFKKRNTLYLKVACGNYFPSALSALNSATLKRKVDKEARFPFDKYAQYVAVGTKQSAIHNLHTETFLVETSSYPDQYLFVVFHK